MKKDGSIERSTLNDQAYVRIKKDILYGALKQNTIYSEQWFADYLNVSRTPIRDAILRLKREHYVDVLPNRGVRLRPISKQELLEVSQLRIAVDSFCSAYFAESILTAEGQAAFEALKATNNNEIQMLSETDKADHSRDVEFIALDLKFHAQIVEFTGNARLIDMNRELHSYLSLLGVEVVKIDERKRESIEENQLIINAIGRGDETGAYYAAKEHVLAIQKRLLTLL